MKLIRFTGMLQSLSAQNTLLVGMRNSAAISCRMALVIATGLTASFMWTGIASAADWVPLPPWAVSPPWPDAIELDSPDPVTGKDEIYETWAYTEAFAKRFSNLPIEKARKDMAPGLQAVAFRVYKRLGGWSASHAPYYDCALDVYVDASIAPEDKAVPDDSPIYAPELAYPGNSLRRLSPVQKADIESKTAQDALRFGRFLRYTPVAFLDGVLDARYERLGAEFRANALPGINLITVGRTEFCKGALPVISGRKYILSILGNDPYQYQQIIEQAYKHYDPDNSPGGQARKHISQLERSGSAYHWKPEDSEKGLLALPEDLAKKMMTKSQAAMALNSCTQKEVGLARGGYKQMSDDVKEKMRAGCQSLRQTGGIADVFSREIEIR